MGAPLRACFARAAVSKNNFVAHCSTLYSAPLKDLLNIKYAFFGFFTIPLRTDDDELQLKL